MLYLSCIVMFAAILLLSVSPSVCHFFCMGRAAWIKLSDWLTDRLIDWLIDSLSAETCRRQKDCLAEYSNAPVHNNSHLTDACDRRLNNVKRWNMFSGTETDFMGCGRFICSFIHSPFLNSTVKAMLKMAYICESRFS